MPRRQHRPPTNAAWTRLDREIIGCTRCPRLLAHCRKIGKDKRAAFRDWDYWAKPVPNFGAGDARLLILGLAPAAHGANRTGRMFTGDRCGDFLYDALHRVGLANQPTSTHRGDGLVLKHTLVTAAAHCAPPGNKPSMDELGNCAEWLQRTLDGLADLRVILCLGKIALDALLRHYKAVGVIRALADYPFVHGAEYRIDGAPRVLCSYHPSQQNTFTGKLTMPMLLAVLVQAKETGGMKDVE